MSGEIGGSAEEEAAEYIAAHVTKPVVGYIAGFTAPEGKQMATLAQVSGSAGTAKAKAEALESRACALAAPPPDRRDRHGDPRFARRLTAHPDGAARAHAPLPSRPVGSP